MKTSRSNGRWARTAAAVTLGAVVMIGSSVSAVRAQDDDEDVLPDVKIFRSLLHGLGLRRDERGIDYRERSPLVLPPNHQLPVPEADKPAQKAADWPVDPDLKRAKDLKEARRKQKPHVIGVDDRPLLPSQYGSSAPPGGHGDGGGPNSVEKGINPMTPVELGAKSLLSSIWSSKDEYATFAGEPPRESLIDPPAGYRTPSPDQPYGAGQEKWKPPPDAKHELIK